MNNPELTCFKGLNLDWIKKSSKNTGSCFVLGTCRQIISVLSQQHPEYAMPKW